MKRFFYIAIIVMAIASCQEQPKKDVKAIEPIENAKNIPQQLTKEIPSPPTDPAAWQISTATASKMKLYYKGCDSGCVDYMSILDSNKIVYNAIKAQYPKGVITPVVARYKDKEDEDRYCSLRKLSKPGACLVKKYKTIIYKVTNPVKKTIGSLYSSETELYYDIITICPPPRDCGSSDTSLHHD